MIFLEVLEAFRSTLVGSENIDECIEDAKKNGGDKEPILAGIFQKKDLEIVKKILA
ncbi:MAG: hypothetical protein QM289_07725 [Bacillota bacterium]|jgi:hypothetical protein|nr:hypothetical protein [Bacillota bacterium]